MTPAKRRLLVEGGADKRVIPYLMEANGVVWPKGQEPVSIDAQGSVGEILQPGVIGAELRASELEALGVMVDADRDAAARWRELKARCRGEFDSLPAAIPTGGLNTVHKTGTRFGVWIMPDNRFEGMLEDFLIRLMPPESEPLYDLAQRCVGNASELGARFSANHRSKAELHTWLAWQDEPGKQLHEAAVLDLKLTRRIGRTNNLEVWL